MRRTALFRAASRMLRVPMMFALRTSSQVDSGDDAPARWMTVSMPVMRLRVWL